MTGTTEKDSNTYINWLEKAISEIIILNIMITLIFTNKEEIINWIGSFGKVFCLWKHADCGSSQSVNAVECLNNEGIIHRDLHAQNVLVHQNKKKLTDFGLPRKIIDISYNSTNILGVVPYIDPKYLNNIKDKSQPYKLNAKSDVYSVGVLLWKISSGHRPFYAENDREKIVKDTPIEYSNLYKACWEDDPTKRPTIHQVVKFLKQAIFGKNNDEINSLENKTELLQENHSQSIIPNLACMLSNNSMEYIMLSNTLLTTFNILNVL